MTTSVNVNDTTSSISINEEWGPPLCHLPLYVIKIATLVIGIIMMTASLIVIPCHRRLRKRHFIFPYNLVLSDLTGAIVLAILEGVLPFYSIPEQYNLPLDILLLTSYLVSLLTLVFITGYQYITIQIDPFGTRNIITTPRLIITCVLAWAIMLAMSTATALTNYFPIFFLSILFTSTVVTGLCYLCIYRAIAKVPCDGLITLERKEENRRVLRTFGFVFGTNVLCWMCPWVSFVVQTVLNVDMHCLNTAVDLMINVNWIANSIIYWWRLKEIRSLFSFCKRFNGTVAVQITLETDQI